MRFSSGNSQKRSRVSLLRQCGVAPRRCAALETIRMLGSLGVSSWDKIDAWSGKKRLAKRDVEVHRSFCHQSRRPLKFEPRVEMQSPGSGAAPPSRHAALGLLADQTLALAAQSQNPLGARSMRRSWFPCFLPHHPCGSDLQNWPRRCDGVGVSEARPHDARRQVRLVHRALQVDAKGEVLRTELSEGHGAVASEAEPRRAEPHGA